MLDNRTRKFAGCRTQFYVDLCVDYEPIGNPRTLSAVADVIDPRIIEFVDNDSTISQVESVLCEMLDSEFSVMCDWFAELFDFDLDELAERRIASGYPKPDVLYDGTIVFDVAVETKPLTVDASTKHLLDALAKNELSVYGLFELAEREGIEGVDELRRFVEGFRSRFDTETDPVRRSWPF